MENIELVVKIPEEAYKLLKNEGVDWLGAEHILDAVANGIPLPKGHGRLIDEKEINTVINGVFMDNEKYSSRTFLEVITKQCLAIIEADKAESEG